MNTKIFFLIIVAFVIILSISLLFTGCGNENWGFGNYQYGHIHFFNGVEGHCATVKSWHDNEIGCEVHTPNGSIYVSEGTYQLFESDKTCPYC